MSLALQELTALKKLNSNFESDFRTCTDLLASVQLHCYNCGTSRFSLCECEFNPSTLNEVIFIYPGICICHF